MQSPMPTELELKLAVRPADLPQLQIHPRLVQVLAGPPRMQAMRAHYYDTPAGLLASQKMSLRVRHEGDGWVQTFKTASGEALALRQRGEWETKVTSDALDWVALAQTPLAELPEFAKLKTLLKRAFTMRFERRSWVLALPTGEPADTTDDAPGEATQAIFSIDQGEISVGTGVRKRTAPLSEVELEHVSGKPLPIWKLAQRLCADVALIPLSSSKAERGWELLRNVPVAPVKAKPPKLHAQSSPVQAFAASVSSPLAALQHNLRHLQAADVEYVHLARVALRRLRTVLRAFGPLPECAVHHKAVDAQRGPLRALGQLLGTARDADVFALETLPAMRDALSDEVSDALDTVAHLVALRRTAAYEAIAIALVQPAHGQALLRAERLTYDLMTAPPDGEKAKKTARPLLVIANTMLADAHEKVQHAARDLTRLSPLARHDLRIEVKRLRYLLDLWAKLYTDAQLQKYRDALADLQEELGVINDAAVAGEMLTELQAPKALTDAWQVEDQRRLVKALPRVAQGLAALDLCPAPWR